MKTVKFTNEELSQLRYMVKSFTVNDGCTTKQREKEYKIISEIENKLGVK